MAVAFDAGTSKVATGGDISWSHTVGSGANRLLLVWVSLDGDKSVVGVTYNGVSLALLTTISSGSARTNARCELWYLIDPPTGANTVAVDQTGGSGRGIAATAVSLLNASTIFSATANHATSGNPTVTVASASGQIVVDGVAAKSAGVLTALAVGGGQTERAKGIGSSSDAWCGSSTEAGAASVVMSWSMTLASGSDKQWATISVSLKTAAVATIGGADTPTGTLTSHRQLLGSMGGTDTPAGALTTKAVRRRQFGVTAVLQATQQLTFGVTARIVSRQTKTFDASAILMARRSLTFGVTALKFRPGSRTFGVSARLIARRFKTFAVSALLAPAAVVRYASHVTNSIASATSLTVSKPSGVVDWDVLVMCIRVGAAGRTITWPAGWTEIGQMDGAAATQHWGAAWKSASGEGASWSVSIDGTNTGIKSLVVRITGATKGPGAVNASAMVANPAGTSLGIGCLTTRLGGLQPIQIGGSNSALTACMSSGWTQEMLDTTSDSAIDWWMQKKNEPVRTPSSAGAGAVSPAKLFHLFVTVVVVPEDADLVDADVVSV